MGWKTDWLYHRIFDIVRDVWDRVHAMDTLYGDRSTNALGSLLVSQYADADLTTAFCTSSVLREWFFDGATFRKYVLPGNLENILPTSVPDNRLGSLYTQGRVAFCIVPDRKHVLITCVLRPLYGHGIIYAVSGQGRRGLLSPAPGYPCWVT